MSTMSAIATSLDLDWSETNKGYEHRSGGWSILWWNSNRITAALYRRVAEGGLVHIMDSDLSEAVDFVERMT